MVTVDPADRVLFIATPLYGGLATQNYLFSLMASLPVLADAGIKVVLSTMGSESLITRARNHQVSVFLADPILTHMIFIDADIGFSSTAILSLMNADFDVSAVTYPKKAYNFDKMRQALLDDPSISADAMRECGIEFVMNIAENVVDGRVPLYKGSFIKVRETGTGFLLMKKNALMSMVQAHPELKYKNDSPAYARYDDTSYALFDTAIETDTERYLSEDYSFCKLWRENGGDIYINTDPAQQLSHTGPHTFVGDVRVFLAGPVAKSKEQTLTS